MDREEFIHGYMTRSGFNDYRVDGDRVYFSDTRYKHALPCKCRDEGCEGWAMVYPSGYEWHLFMNELPGAKPTAEGAMRADLDAEKEPTEPERPPSI
jgi:hypothetical protein